MSYDFSTGGAGASIKASELIVSVYDQVEAGFYEALYPEILWKTILPAESIKTDINPGAMSYVYRSRDFSGMGQFVQGSVANIPRVGQSVGQVSVPILDAAVGATLTDSEARKYQYAYQTALAQDYGEIMKKASEYHVERTFFFGSVAAGFPAFLDHPNINKIPVSAFDPTNPLAGLVAINGALTAVYMNSLTIHMPDTIFMPPDLIAALANTPMTLGTGSVSLVVTALDWLREKTIFSALSVEDGGEPKKLKIRPLRYLHGAGVANVSRCIIGEWIPRNFMMPFPLPYQLSQPVPIALGVEMFAEYVFGPFHPRYPGAFAYIDGL
jgi:hypothetical protein